MFARGMGALALAMTLAMALAAGGAQAAVITRTFSFSAEILPRAGRVTPYDPFAGVFTVTWDNAQDYLDETSGLTVHSLSVPRGPGAAFSYRASLDSLVFEGLNGGAIFQTGVDDFILTIADASTADAHIGLARYAIAGEQTAFNAGRTSFSTSAAPEPRAWAVLILGLGLVGARLRARRESPGHA